MSAKKENTHKRFSILGKLSSSNQQTTGSSSGTSNTKTHNKQQRSLGNGIPSATTSTGTTTSAKNKRITIHLPDTSTLTSGHQRSHSNGKNNNVGEKLLSSDLNNNINSLEKFGYTLPSLPTKTNNNNNNNIYNSNTSNNIPSPSSQLNSRVNSQPIAITTTLSPTRNTIPTPLAKSPKPPQFPPLPKTPTMESPISPVSPNINNNDNGGMLNRSSSTINSTSSSFYPSVNSSTENFHESKTSVQSTTYPYSSYHPIQSSSSIKRDPQYLLEQQQKSTTPIPNDNSNTNITMPTTISPPQHRPLSKPPTNSYNLSIRRKPPPPLINSSDQDISKKSLSPITPTIENKNPLSVLNSPTPTITQKPNEEGSPSGGLHPTSKTLPPLPKEEEEEEDDKSNAKYNTSSNNHDLLLSTIESEIQALRPQETKTNDNDHTKSTNNNLSLPLEHPELGNSNYSLNSSKATTPLNFGNSNDSGPRPDHYLTSSPTISQSQTLKRDELRFPITKGIPQSPSITNFQEVLHNFHDVDDDEDENGNGIDDTILFSPPKKLRDVITNSPESGISTTDDEEFFDVPESFEEFNKLDNDDIEEEKEEFEPKLENDSVTSSDTENVVAEISMDDDSDDNEGVIFNNEVEHNNVRRSSYVSRDSHEMVSSEEEEIEETNDILNSGQTDNKSNIKPLETEYEEDEFSFHNKSVPSSPQFQRHGLQIFTPFPDTYDSNDQQIEEENWVSNGKKLDEEIRNNVYSSGEHYLQKQSQLNDDEDDDDDDDDVDNDLTFTASPPYYTRFDFPDDNEPKRTMMVVNPSDGTSDDDDDDDNKEEEEAEKNGVEQEELQNNKRINSIVSIEDNTLEELYPTSKNSNSNPDITRPESPNIVKSSIPQQQPIKFPNLTSSYDRREQPTIVPISHTEAKHNSNSKTLPRRPPPDFPSVGRNTRSISDVTAHSDLFENVKTTGALNDQNLLKSTKDDDFNETINQILSKSTDENNNEVINKNIIINNNDTNKTLVNNNLKDNEEVEEIPTQLKLKGKKSIYVTNMRKRASASYSESVPSIKVLPIAIRPTKSRNSSSSHRRVNSNNLLHTHTRSHSKNGSASFNMSDAAIKHGGLKSRTRMLASEIDDDELPDSKLYHDEDQTKKPTDPDAYVLEAAEQLKRLASPYLDKASFSSNNDLQQSTSNTSTNSNGNNSNNSNNNNNNNNQNNNNNSTNLNRFASVRSARRFGSISGNDNSKRFTLFIANPDGSDSD